MSNVILGLLMLWPQSLYELTKNFEAGISLFYSASTGSIKRSLDRMLADGHIGVASQDGPRGKKTYAITEAGREKFRNWMLAELPSSDFETAVLARTYFLGLLQPHERPTVVAHIEERIRSELGRLERLEAQALTLDVPEGFEDVAAHQLATLQYGLASCRTALAWSKEHLTAPPMKTTT
ncbi:helix-turn-helix transcriptional regulator [Microbacterium sp. gxy059]|uniref:helix-turn-helix transcriptional regulator n=1 Tax=Microbacterium sp. gxy059 TaxID=2957199 RepID=UPI003D9797A0